MGKFNPDTFLKDNGVSVVKKSTGKSSFNPDTFLKDSESPQQITEEPQQNQTMDWVENNVLSGQLRALGAGAGGIGGAVLGAGAGGIGAIPGSLGGAGLGGAFGTGLETIIKSLLDLQETPTIGQQAYQMADAGLWDAATEGLGMGAGKLISKGAGAVKRGIKSRAIPNYFRGVKEGIPVVGKGSKLARETIDLESKELFDLGEATRRASFDADEAAKKAARIAAKETTEESIKQLPKRNLVNAGDNLTENVKRVVSKVDSDLDVAAKPVIKKYGSNQISAEPIRKHIIEILDSQGFIDDGGNILYDEASRLTSPERKTLIEKLIRYSEDLTVNPTVRRVDQVRRDLQSLAGFEKISRSSEDKILGSLSRSVKETFYDGLKEIASPDEVSKIMSAREIYSKNQNILKQLKQISRKAPENVVRGASSSMPGSFIEEAIRLQPELKEPIAEVVINDIVRGSKSHRSLSAIIDKYGRDSIKKLLGNSTFNKLLKLESSLVDVSKPVTRGRFIPNAQPKKPLGKVWQSVLNNAEKGEKIGIDKAGALFQQLSQQVNIIQKQSENIEKEQ